MADPLRWFDAHLDLACLAENGRDMRRDPEAAGGPWTPAGVTFPSLAEGNVAACMGTIFTEADGADAVAYAAGDAEGAHAAGVRQLGWYERWRAAGVVRLWRKGEASPLPPAPSLPTERPAAPLVLVLMEGADPIRSPEEVEWWAGRGVAAIGMAWARGSRYAAGNSAPAFTGEAGLTPIGRELARRMDALGIVHDLSHLSQRATDELLALTDAPVIASHSNCRALLDGKSERHLADETIREIARRGGIVGLNLFAPFLRHGLGERERPTIEETVRHVERVCEVAGDRRAVGLGSDMDGGFSALRLPEGIGRPRDVVRLAEALSRRGWSDGQVHDFAWGNWARFWGLGADS